VQTADGHLEVEGCRNFRDAGGWVDGDGRQMRTGVLYRADDPIRLTARGRAAVDALALAAVVDVRQHAQHVRSPGFVDVSRTFHRPLVDRVINLDDPPRLEQASDLADVYEDMIERSREQLADVLDIIATHLEAGAVLVHCAYGKDRTGIIVALIQAAIGMPAEVIASDYGRSDQPSRSRYRWVMDEPLPDDPPLWKAPAFLFTAPEAAMAELVSRAVARHGSLDGWVRSFPVAAATVPQLRRGLLAD
jgi:protein-tyrosine phosphatase